MREEPLVRVARGKRWARAIL